jgi:hypothetical protein
MPDSGLMMGRLEDEFIQEPVSTEPGELGRRRLMEEMERAALLLVPGDVDREWSWEQADQGGRSGCVWRRIQRWIAIAPAAGRAAFPTRRLRFVAFDAPDWFSGMEVSFWAGKWNSQRGLTSNISSVIFTTALLENKGGHLLARDATSSRSQGVYPLPIAVSHPRHFKHIYYSLRACTRPGGVC